MKKLSYNHSLGEPITLLSNCLKSLRYFLPRPHRSSTSHGRITSLKKTKISSILSWMERWSPSPTPLKTQSRVLDCLQGRPNCQKFRKDSIWGIEFFDPIFAFPEDPISFYLDADILFLRPFSGLFDRNQVKNGAIFLKDTQWDAYCFRPWQMLTR